MTSPGPSLEDWNRTGSFQFVQSSTSWRNISCPLAPFVGSRILLLVPISSAPGRSTCPVDPTWVLGLDCSSNTAAVWEDRWADGTRDANQRLLAGKVLLVWSVASDAKNSTGSPPTFTSSIDLWEGIASSSSSSTVSSPSWEGGAEVVSGEEISGHSISSCRRG